MPHDPFDRRTLIKGFAGGAAALWAADESFPQDRDATLKALALVVLPASFGRGKTDKIADKFVRWVRGYSPGAEIEHGYGFPKLESRPPSPGPRYVEQLRSLVSKGFVEMKAAGQVALIEDELKGLKGLPRIPAGQNVIVDLMSFYFFSAEASDHCYEADIRADACRGFEHAGESPARRKA